MDLSSTIRELLADSEFHEQCSIVRALLKIKQLSTKALADLVPYVGRSAELTTLLVRHANTDACMLLTLVYASPSAHVMREVAGSLSKFESVPQELLTILLQSDDSEVRMTAISKTQGR